MSRFPVTSCSAATQRSTSSKLRWCWLSMMAGLALTTPLRAQQSAFDQLRAASQAAAEGDSERAVALASKALEQQPDMARAYYVRGRENFRLGKISHSLRDFNRYIQLEPAAAPQQWERGITCYYAGEFTEGAKQFELYQTFHDNDVENSVWRYLCVARTDGIEKARQTMLPIRNDPRVPMMQIFDLYRGKLQPEDVLKAARSDNPPDDILAGRLFYAHLYLGLYHEAAGEKKLADRHLRLAAKPLAETAPVNRYMWDVARVHVQRLKETAANE